MHFFTDLVFSPLQWLKNIIPLFPGAVENLHAVALNDHVLRVSWDPPSSPIGDITEYQLVVTNLVNSAQNVCTIPKDALEKNVSDGIRENYLSTGYKDNIICQQVPILGMMFV